MQTVLCVDDAATLENLSNKIRNAGYRCLAASSDDEAERLFVANTVDLVILRNSPDLNREGLAAHLKRIRGVKILMLTRNLSLFAVPQSVDLLLADHGASHELLKAVATLTSVVVPPADRARDAQ